MSLPLKQLHELCKPDPRSRGFARIDKTGRRHEKTISDHQEDIASIRMTDNVPDDIRRDFETLRNLYLYSWYVYEFTVPAELYAYALIEKTIKEKYSQAKDPNKAPHGLKKLLGLSVDEGWLKNSDFAIAQPRYHPDDIDYCERLVDTMPPVRNLGAHGEAGLGFPRTTLEVIRRCAEVANALFKDSGTTQFDPKTQ